MLHVYFNDTFRIFYVVSLHYSCDMKLNGSLTRNGLKLQKQVIPHQWSGCFQTCITFKLNHNLI